MNDVSRIDVSAAVDLAAVDDDFYGHYFFPRTFRQVSPSFAHEIQQAFDDPVKRYIAMMLFRGSGKTARVRCRVSKHIAYGLSRTILFVSNAQKHSIYSLRWLKRQIEFNTLWTQAFGLEKGDTWSDEIIEIRNRSLGTSTHVIPLGITGQVRGINLDDFRPDFIVLDDPDNEETTNTVDQREKTSDLVLGALLKSLAPPTEAPLAKFALLQTPFNKFDLIHACFQSDNFAKVQVGCFNAAGESVWEERFPTKFLQGEKENHVKMNKLSIWMREMECRIIAQELSSFRFEWLRFWDVTPERMRVVIAVDPASSDSKDADDQVIGALGFYKGDCYLLEYRAVKGQNPEEAAMYFLELIRKYRPMRGAVESISYQRTLAWYIEKRMAESRTWLSIDRVQDKRRKADRIVQEIGSYASRGKLYVRREHTQFTEQFIEYSPTFKGHDDVLDMIAIGIMSYSNIATYEGDYEIVDDEKDIPELGDWRAAL